MSTSRGQASIMVKTVGVEATFLVLHAGSDRGYRLARDLLEAGSRVAVTSRYATDIARILHGYPAEQVLTIAADESQLNQVINRVESRWGRVNAIIDADTVGDAKSIRHNGVPLEAA
jgi:short-subunit dehydrogenase involved in D-alanine esterification of teichoic acids